ncbi:hypothetical protein [Microvirga sp. KLBC 81]|nr:hypothetical protein [Microvirga sp. KLBC 81]
MTKQIDQLGELLKIQSDWGRWTSNRSNLDGHGLPVIGNPDTDPRLGHGI